MRATASPTPVRPRSGPRAPVRTALLAALAAAAWVAVLAVPAAAVSADVLEVTRATVDEGLPGNLSTAPPEGFAPALAPGGAALLRLEVTNTAGVAVEALVYGADVEAGAGAPAVGDGRENTGVGAWIVADEGRLVLEPGETLPVTLTITRPDDDTDGGTGAVVVQLSDESRVRLGLGGVTRAAFPVEVAADGRGESPVVSALEVDVDLGLLPGTAHATVTLTNPGPDPVEAPLRLLVDGAPTDPDGLVTDDGRTIVDLGTTRVPPGGEVVRTADLPAVAWFGGVLRVSAEAGDAGLRSVSPSTRLVVAPLWTVAALVLLTLAATVRAAGAVRAARAAGRSAAAHDPAPTDVADDAHEDTTALDVPIEVVPADEASPDDHADADEPDEAAADALGRRRIVARYRDDA